MLLIAETIFSLSQIILGLQSWYPNGVKIIRESLLLTSRTHSLGAVLLEIGLWQSLETFERANEPS